jgi:hypothetical protein
VEVLVAFAGLGSVALGIWHLGVPVWFHARAAVERGGRRPLPHVRLAPVRYGTTARDVVAVVWVMNLAASYGLITIGIALLAAPLWAGTPGGRVVAFWIAGWWVVRAAAQIAFGRRRLDLLVMGVFAGLGALSVWLAVR